MDLAAFPVEVTAELEGALAERIMMRWTGRDRFLTDWRPWVAWGPCQPSEGLPDGYRFLESAERYECSVHAWPRVGFTAQVRLCGKIDGARDTSDAPAVSDAISHAIGLEPQGRHTPLRSGGAGGWTRAFQAGERSPIGSKD